MFDSVLGIGNLYEELSLPEKWSASSRFVPLPSKEIQNAIDKLKKYKFWPKHFLSGIDWDKTKKAMEKVKEKFDLTPGDNLLMDFKEKVKGFAISPTDKFKAGLAIM